MLLGWTTILWWLLLDWTIEIPSARVASAAPDASSQAIPAPLRVKQWTADG